MSDLRQTRKKIKTALAVMAGLDLLALVIYISPLVGSAESRRQQINELQGELKTKTTQVAPLKDLPQKVQLASHQISDFYKKRIPEQQSQFVAELGKLAAPNGVTVEQVRYKPKDVESGSIEPWEMELDLVGSYTALAKFINALERDDMFFIIDSVTLGGEQQGPVKLSMKLEAFLKAGA